MALRVWIVRSDDRSKAGQFAVVLQISQAAGDDRIESGPSLEESEAAEAFTVPFGGVPDHWVSRWNQAGQCHRRA